MAFRTTYLFLSAIAALSACDTTESGLVTPDETGAIPVDANEIYNSGVVRSANNGGFSYATGDKGTTVFDAGVFAFAGILPQTDVGITPTVGSATMTGQYEIAVAENAGTQAANPSSGIFVQDGDRQVSIIDQQDSSGVVNIWVTSVAGGSMSATVDFERGTISGSNADDSFVVSGSFGPDGEMTGSSNFRGLSGDLGGLVGGEEVVASVAGDNTDTIFAGGFILSQPQAVAALP